MCFFVCMLYDKGTSRRGLAGIRTLLPLEHQILRNPATRRHALTPRSAGRAADANQGLAQVYHQGLGPHRHQHAVVLLSEALPLRDLTVPLGTIGSSQWWRHVVGLPVPGVDFSTRPDEGLLFVMQDPLFLLGATE